MLLSEARTRQLQTQPREGFIGGLPLPRAQRARKTKAQAVSLSLRAIGGTWACIV